MRFSEFIKRERQKQFETPAEFYRKGNLSCSYYHYTKIENGNTPDIPLAVEILRALNVPIKKGIYSLIRTKLPDKESRALFNDPEESDFKGYSDTVTFDRAFIVNPSQVELLCSNPLYLELALFMSCNLEKCFSSEEIASVFKIQNSEAVEFLLKLKEIGLIYGDGNRYWTKNWIYTPDDNVFVQLKDSTLKRALDKYLNQPADSRWQKTLTVNVTPIQKKAIEDMLENLSFSIVGISDTSNESKTLTVGLFSSWRTFGNA
jgi:hypothetical protein